MSESKQNFGRKPAGKNPSSWMGNLLIPEKIQRISKIPYKQ